MLVVCAEPASKNVAPAWSLRASDQRTRERVRKAVPKVQPDYLIRDNKSRYAFELAIEWAGIWRSGVCSPRNSVSKRPVKGFARGAEVERVPPHDVPAMELGWFGAVSPTDHKCLRSTVHRRRPFECSRRVCYPRSTA
jgi:hypothetical protein